MSADFVSRLLEVIAEAKLSPESEENLDEVYAGVVAKNTDSIFAWVRIFPVHTEQLFKMRVYRGSMTKTEIASAFYEALTELASRVVSGNTTPRNHGSALHYQFKTVVRRQVRAELKQERIAEAVAEGESGKAYRALSGQAQKILSFVDDEMARKVVELSVVDGKTIREVAEILEVSKTTAHRKLEEGMKQLKEVHNVDS